jgi:hypothetical protein
LAGAAVAGSDDRFVHDDWVHIMPAMPAASRLEAGRRKINDVRSGSQKDPRKLNHMKPQSFISCLTAIAHVTAQIKMAATIKIESSAELYRLQSGIALLS